MNLARPGRRTPFAGFRSALHRSLHRQIRDVEKTGTRVLLIEPEGRAADLIGLNFTNRTRSHAVARAAGETVLHRLRETRAKRLLDVIRTSEVRVAR